MMKRIRVLLLVSLLTCFGGCFENNKVKVNIEMAYVKDVYFDEKPIGYNEEIALLKEESKIKIEIETTKGTHTFKWKPIKLGAIGKGKTGTGSPAQVEITRDGQIFSFRGEEMSSFN